MASSTDVAIDVDSDVRGAFAPRREAEAEDADVEVVDMDAMLPLKPILRGVLGGGVMTNSMSLVRLGRPTPRDDASDSGLGTPLLKLPN